MGIIAASIPTLKPLFNPSRPSVLRYFKRGRRSERCRRTSRKATSKDANDQVRLNILTLDTMPGALPSSLSYYQEKCRNHGNGWDGSESQLGMSVPEKVHVIERECDMGRGVSLEDVGDGGVHAIGDSFV